MAALMNQSIFLNQGNDTWWVQWAWVTTFQDYCLRRFSMIKSSFITKICSLKQRWTKRLKKIWDSKQKLLFSNVKRIAFIRLITMALARVKVLIIWLPNQKYIWFKLEIKRNSSWSQKDCTWSSLRELEIKGRSKQSKEINEIHQIKLIWGGKTDHLWIK